MAFKLYIAKQVRFMRECIVAALISCTWELLRSTFDADELLLLA
jgi:hypothetical protein